MESQSKVLLVEDDVGVRRAMYRVLEESCKVIEAASVAEGLQKLEEHDDVQAIVLDLVLPDGGGLDLLQILRDRGLETPTVVVSGHLSPTTFQAAMDLGAVKVLEKGAALHELSEAIALALECGTGTRGSLHGLSLIDVLQMFHWARRTVDVVVVGGQPGLVVMHHGEIVHAEAGELVGREALQELLSRNQAAVRTAASVMGDVEQTIAAPFEALLLDCLRLVDEQNHIAGTGRASPLPSFFPVTSEPPSSSGSLSALDGESTLERLVSVLEGTVLRLCPGACTLHAEPGVAPTWLHRRPADDEPSEEILAAALNVAQGSDRWDWMLRSSPTLVIGFLRSEPSSVTACITANLSRSTQGQMLAGLRAARTQLDAMMAEPSATDTSVVRRTSMPPSPPAIESVASAARGLLKALADRGALASRVWEPVTARWWCATSHDDNPGGSPSHHHWTLGVDLLCGELGLEVERRGIQCQGLSPTDQGLDAEVLMATDEHYLFGRVLPTSRSHLMVACHKVPAMIGPMAASLRRHDKVSQLDETLAAAMASSSTLQQLE